MATTEEQLLLTSSPHIAGKDTVNGIMFSVVAALIPAAVAAVIFFGWNAFKLMLVCVVTAVIAEAIFMRLRGYEMTWRDGSAIVTGLLLAMNLPPTLPAWMAVVGSAVAIILGKQVFGGLGHNPFNPALIGRAFLLAAFPVHMTTWVRPFDGVTTATPLAAMKMEGIATSYSDLFWGNVGGCLGETSAFALLIGAAYLLYRGYIDWRIPAGYLGTVGVLMTLFGQDPVFHWLAGGMILGAFFMATDMVTSPITRTGKWIFAIGGGLIVVVIRLWGGYPEGVSYSILLMNAFTPLIDKFTRPKPFGEVKASA